MSTQKLLAKDRNSVVSLLSNDQKDFIVSEICAGKTVARVERELGLTVTTVHKVAEQDTSFRERIIRARITGTDALVDTLHTVADDEPDVQRARLKSDNIKWVASRLNPQQYGDRINMDVRHSVDLDSAMLEARERIVNKMPQLVDITEEIEEAEVIPDMDDLLS
jgi:predicted transcriptional regulator